MRTIKRTGEFKRDYKRELKKDCALGNVLASVLKMLAADFALPEKFRDHQLIGNWKGFRECHLRPDLLLIYSKPSDGTLRLVRLGSHSELLGG